MFARRIAGFDTAAVEVTKALPDWASLPDEGFGPGLAAFFQTSGRPGNAARVMYLFENGLQTRPAWNWTWDALWANFCDLAEHLAPLGPSLNAQLTGHRRSCRVQMPV